MWAESDQKQKSWSHLSKWIYWNLLKFKIYINIQRKNILFNEKAKSENRGSPWEEIEEIKENSNGKVDRLKRKITQLSAKTDDYQLMEEESIKNKGSLVKLYDLGVVDSDGDYKE